VSKKKLNEAFKHITPDNFEEILKECKNIEKKGVFMNEKNDSRKWGWFKNLSFVACGMLVAFIGIFAINGYNNNIVDSTISFDVNPSIKLEVNKKDKIISAEALNNDGNIILDKMDLKNTDIHIAINAIIGSMLKNGYISELQNSVLVSVSNKDEIKGYTLEKQITEDISEMLKNSNIEISILSQTLNNDTELEKLADENNISIGKVKLIKEIISINNTLTIEELSKISINDLNLIKESKNIESDKITKVGSNPSEKSYIGKDKAKIVALENASIEEKNIINIEIDFDMADGILIYEVDFETNQYEYEYDINASTGEIINIEKEINEDYIEEKVENTNKETVKENTNQQSTIYIGKDKAKDIALNKAGLNEKNIKDYEIELDKKEDLNDKDEYEISFKKDNVEYEIDIDAKTGEILDFKKEKDD